MFSFFANFLQGFEQALALVGGVTVLLLCFFVGVILQHSDTEESSARLRVRLAQQFLSFTAVIVLAISLMMVGLPFWVPLLMTFGLMLIVHRWLLLLTLLGAGGFGIFTLLLH